MDYSPTSYFHTDFCNPPEALIASPDSINQINHYERDTADAKPTAKKKLYSSASPQGGF